MAFKSYNQSYTSKSPGSLMIMGEHAVLFGAPCLVAAIDRFLTVKLDIVNNNNKTRIIINTDINKFSRKSEANNISFDLQDLSDLSSLDRLKPFNYIIAVILYFKESLLKFKYNYSFTINSDINPEMGLGSSAALIGSAVDVILKYLDPENNNKSKILKIGHKIINDLQGRGSGADLAASLYGGVVYYKVANYVVEKIMSANNLPLVVVYSGYKLETKIVIKKIADIMKGANNNNFIIYNKIFELIADLVNFGKECIIEQNWQQLGLLCNQHYGLQEALGISDQKLSAIVYNLRSYLSVFGAKISGSGLGDCVIAIGAVDYINNNLNNLNFLDIKITNQGLS